MKASAPHLLDDVQPYDTTELAEALEQLDEDEQHPEMIILDAPPELLSSLEKTSENDLPDTFDVKVLDGVAVVHLLPVSGVKTFEDYAADMFLTHVRHQLQIADRVDIVWDRCLKKSIKGSSREKRGKGMRRKVSGKNKIQDSGRTSCVMQKTRRNSLNFCPRRLKAVNFLLAKQWW